ncbi:MAG: exonuclease domain-containing protein [Pseudomonadota bacterium]|nr:exonuclease domain-containing protein [Pseudomonadota bacterium]
MSSALGINLQRMWWRHKATHPTLQALLSEPLQSQPFQQTRYVVIDLETTALNPEHGEIASIAWVVIEQATICLNQAAHYHVRLEKEVGQSAVFHQLTDSDLEQGVHIKEALAALLQVLSHSTLVFHNAHLDMGFLNKALRALWGAPLLLPVVDTLQVERKRLQQRTEAIPAGDLRLFQCRQRYGLPDVPLHDALGDALATAELWLAMQH